MKFYQICPGLRKDSRKSSAKSNGAIPADTWPPRRRLRPRKKVQRQCLPNVPERRIRSAAAGSGPRPAAGWAGPILGVPRLRQNRRWCNGHSGNGRRPPLGCGWRAWVWECTWGELDNGFICFFLSCVSLPPSTCLSLSLLICLSDQLFVCLSVCSFISLFICLFVHLLACLSVCLSIYLPVHLYVCPFISLFICLFVHY
jgi:hypothetical protein